MALTVFAEKMGFFHKGCAGIGVAPVDVCLTPPGVPVPYTNVLFAKDLIKGSKTVRIDGEPTFLEDYSETSTSIGDEGGSLGSVVTGVHLGKGFFLVWSMTVYIEGLGVCRHGDMMGQNSASAPHSSPNGGALAQPANVSAPVPGPVASATAAEGEVLDATGPGDSVPLEAVPCAMDKIEIECDHTGHGDEKRNFDPFEFTFNGQIQTNDTSDRNDPPIGVIARHTDAEADTIKIKLTGGPGYTCSKSHPEILVTNLGDNSEVLKTNGATTAEFKAKTKVAELTAIERMSPAAILEYYWFPRTVIQRYQVQIKACGVLPDGSPGFPGVRRIIEAYPSDTYKFSLEIPEVFNRSYNRPPGYDSDPDTQRGWDEGMRDGSSFFGSGDDGHPITVPGEEILGSISLSRNGETMSAESEKLGEVVKQVQAIIDMIQGTFNYIKDQVPEVGWSFNFKLSFLTGSLTFEWGPKEANNFTVYNWWKFEAALTLIKAEIEVAFGFSGRAAGLSIEAQAFLALSGEVGLNIASIEATPDEVEKNFGTVTAALGFEGGIRATIGGSWLAKGKGAISGGFPFECTPEIRQAQDGRKGGLVLNYKLKQDAIKAKVNVTVLGGTVSDEVWEIVPERDIAEGAFFEDVPPSQGVPSPSGNQGGSNQGSRGRRQRRRRRRN